MTTLNMTEQEGQPAGIGKRALAFLIDQTLLTIVLFATGLALIVITGVGAGLIETHFGLTTDYNYELEFALPLTILGVIQLVFYPTLMECSSKQATVGKTIMGLKVTTSEGNRLTFRGSLARTISKLATILTLGGGFIIGSFMQDKQTLHDLIARTKVISCRRSTEERVTVKN